MDPNSEEAIEGFVRSFEKVAEVIQARNPTCILAPMFGAVPFIDVLNIIDDAFPNEKVEYIAASNRVYRVRDVLRGAFETIIDAYAPNRGSFLSLDEVVSGNSSVRVYTQFDAARMQYANKKTVETYGANADFRLEEVRAFRDSVRNSIQYNSIGVVDSKISRQGKKKNPEYTALVEKGIIIPVGTPCIVTMDRAEFFPAKYNTQRDTQGKQIFLPVVDSFAISPQYIDFLQKVAAMTGRDPDTVTVMNIGKIRNSYKWVPEQLRVY